MEPIASSCGVAVQPDERLGDPARFDYVVGRRTGRRDREPARRRRALPGAGGGGGGALVGVCTGTFALHRAGLMQGYRACVSWFHHEDFLERFRRPGRSRTRSSPSTATG